MLRVCSCLSRLMYWKKFWNAQPSFQTIFTSAAQKGLIWLLLPKACSRSATCLAEQCVYILLQELIWTEWLFILISNTNSILSLFLAYCSYLYIIFKKKREWCTHFFFFQVSFLTSVLFSICCFQENMALTISSLVHFLILWFFY